MAMNPNKQHKQNVKDLETESLQESKEDLEKIENALSDVEPVEEPVQEEEPVETPVEDDELPFEEEKAEYEVDDEFDWKY